MKQEQDGEFGPELSRLEARLRRADFSGESQVRDVLKERLLDPQARRRRTPVLAWLVPAAAAAALLVMFAPRHKAPAPAAQGASYSLPDDGYGACGRQGLQDYQAGERF
jgi:hypothetical protein